MVDHDVLVVVAALKDSALELCFFLEKINQTNQTCLIKGTS